MDYTNLPSLARNLPPDRQNGSVDIEDDLQKVIYKIASKWFKVRQWLDNKQDPVLFQVSRAMTWEWVTSHLKSTDGEYKGQDED